MDPTLRAALVVGVAIFFRHLLLAWWDSFKAREALKPVPMKLRNGVYVPWGRVQRIERVIDRLFVAWVFYIVALLIALAVVKLG